ncbi:MAG: O-antigen ligase family protein, partial [Patescibacteria group bacterium]|nr:O-antigen ligase family protein [Patescibacteria group bacterium]
MSKTEENIFLAIKILLFLAPLSLILVCPGYFCPFNLFFPYITGKAIFFRIIVEIALLLMVIFLLNNKQFFPKKNEYLFWVSVIFIIGIFIVNLFSMRPYLSFWGNAERSEGVWALIHFIIWFWLLWIVFKIDPSFKKTIFYSFLIALYIISFIEIYQGIKLGEIRPSSTLGNATYVGFFANLMLFLCLYFLYKSSPQEKIFIWIGIILSLSSIIISQTRGAILGIVAGLFIFGLYYFLSSKSKIHFKILGLIFVFLVIFSFYQFLLTDYALKIPGINRVAESIKSKEPYMPRLISWGIFLDAWKEKPFLGYGLENSPIAYFKSFNSEIFKYEEVIFDRPHNKYIEILVTNGIIGAIFWLALYLVIIYSIFKNETNNYLRASLLGFFIGYLVQNFTLFDVQASYLPLFFGLALLVPPVFNLKKEKINEAHVLPLQFLIGGLVIIGIIINIYNFYIVRGIVEGLSSPFPRG